MNDPASKRPIYPSLTRKGEDEFNKSKASKRSSIPRFTLGAAFFSAPKPCEDALLGLGNAYNKLADQVEESWAREAALTARLRALGYNVSEILAHDGLE